MDRIEKLAEKLADEQGIYGQNPKCEGHPNDCACRECEDHEDDCKCRMCWTMGVRDRIQKDIISGKIILRRNK